MGYQPIKSGGHRSKVAYFSDYNGMFERSFKLLKPTGKWRIRFDVSSESYKVDLQHKDLIFKRWICEDDVYFRDPPLNAEFDCNER